MSSGLVAKICYLPPCFCLWKWAWLGNRALPGRRRYLADGSTRDAARPSPAHQAHHMSAAHHIQRSRAPQSALPAGLCRAGSASNFSVGGSCGRGLLFSASAIDGARFGGWLETDLVPRQRGLAANGVVGLAGGSCLRKRRPASTDDRTAFGLLDRCGSPRIFCRSCGLAWRVQRRPAARR